MSQPTQPDPNWQPQQPYGQPSIQPSYHGQQQVAAAPPPVKRRRGGLLAGLVAGFLLGSIIGCAVGSANGSTAAAPGTAAPAATVTVTAAGKAGPTITVTAAPKPAQTKAPAAATIGDGTGQAVGTDIDAGSYRTRTDSPLCYFQISDDENGTEIKSNGAGKGTHRVRLKKGDFFDTQRCGTWEKV